MALTKQEKEALKSQNKMLSKSISDATIKMCTRDIKFKGMLDIDGLIFINHGAKKPDVVVKIHQTVIKPVMAEKKEKASQEQEDDGYFVNKVTPEELKGLQEQQQQQSGQLAGDPQGSLLQEIGQTKTPMFTKKSKAPSNKTLTKHIRNAVVKLCTKNSQFKGNLEIDGLICVSPGDKKKEILVRIHQTIIQNENDTADQANANAGAAVVQTAPQTSDSYFVSKRTSTQSQPPQPPAPPMSQPQPITQHQISHQQPVAQQQVQATQQQQQVTQSQAVIQTPQLHQQPQLHPQPASVVISNTFNVLPNNQYQQNTNTVYQNNIGVPQQNSSFITLDDTTFQNLFTPRPLRPNVHYSHQPIPGTLHPPAFVMEETVITNLGGPIIQRAPQVPQIQMIQEQQTQPATSQQQQQHQQQQEQQHQQQQQQQQQQQHMTQQDQQQQQNMTDPQQQQIADPQQQQRMNDPQQQQRMTDPQQQQSMTDSQQQQGMTDPPTSQVIAITPVGEEIVVSAPPPQQPEDDEDSDDSMDPDVKCKNIPRNVVLLGDANNHSVSIGQNTVKSRPVSNKKVPVVCNLCFETLPSKEDLKIHMRIHIAPKPFTCGICSRGFNQESHLKMHNLRMHPQTQLTVQPYQCSVCSKGYSTAGGLRSHMKTHTGEKPFGCQMCDKRFAHKADLVTHTRRHTGERPFPCKICNKRFLRKYDVEKHMQTHTGDKPFKCEMCPLSFAQQYQWNLHVLRKHTDATTKKLALAKVSVMCPVCMKNYSSKHVLKIHMRTHTGERPYKCQVCDKGFVQKSDCIIHMRIHTGEKPYECELCPQKFYRSNHLHRHVKTTH